MGRRRKFRHQNHHHWDVGILHLEDWSATMAVIVESKERRFFPVRQDEAPEPVLVTALEHRFETVGWWATPRLLRIADMSLVEVIRSSEALDGCSIAYIDGLMSIEWARRGVEKALMGEREAGCEVLVVA